MSHDMSLALDLCRQPGRSPLTEVTLRSRLRKRWTQMRTRPHVIADWEQPLERFDRLHAELRHPLGRF
jgi:hypothetical protein